MDRKLELHVDGGYNHDVTCAAGPIDCQQRGGREEKTRGRQRDYFVDAFVDALLLLLLLLVFQNVCVYFQIQTHGGIKDTNSKGFSGSDCVCHVS